MNKPNHRDCPKSDRCKYLNKCPHDYRPCTPYYACFVKGKATFKGKENAEKVVALMGSHKGIREFADKLIERLEMYASDSAEATCLRLIVNNLVKEMEDKE
jgi:hypothetical protein